jgi:hypothetical protein
LVIIKLRVSPLLSLSFSFSFLTSNYHLKARFTDIESFVNFKEHDNSCDRLPACSRRKRGRSKVPVNHFFRDGIVGLVLSRSTDAQHLDYNRYIFETSITLCNFISSVFTELCGRMVLSEASKNVAG